MYTTAWNTIWTGNDRFVEECNKIINDRYGEITNFLVKEVQLKGNVSLSHSIERMGVARV